VSESVYQYTRLHVNLNIALVLCCYSFLPLQCFSILCGEEGASASRL
jgi:hypothetical protein